MALVSFNRPKSIFAAPPWFDREVTDDPRYKNQRLACEGAPDEALGG